MYNDFKSKHANIVTVQKCVQESILYVKTQWKEDAKALINKQNKTSVNRPQLKKNFVLILQKVIESEAITRLIKISWV